MAHRGPYGFKKVAEAPSCSVKTLKPAVVPQTKQEKSSEDMSYSPVAHLVEGVGQEVDVLPRHRRRLGLVASLLRLHLCTTRSRKAAKCLLRPLSCYALLTSHVTCKPLPLL